MNKQTLLACSITLVAGIIIGAMFFGASSGNQAVTGMPAGCADYGVEAVFSCSMHPQVRQAENGVCPFCSMPLIPAKRKEHNNPYALTMSPDAMRLADIRTAPVVIGEQIVKAIRLNGKVVPDESRMFTQVSNLPGRIERLYVNKTGQYVKEGQPIASIYSKDFISVVEALAFSNTSESILRAAKNNLKSWKIPEARLKEFDVKGDYRKPVTIYADASGVVMRKFVQEGDHTANSHMGAPTTLFELADLSRLWVLFDAYEADIPWLAVGDKVTFTVSAYPEKTLSGQINYIDPFLDPHSRTATVRVEVDNREGRLKPEMLVTGIIKAVRKTNAGMLVPKSAVLWTGHRSLVYIRDRQYNIPVFECREVRLAGDFGDYYCIASGLREGEAIVIKGAFTVDAAAQLNNKYSMMNLPEQELENKNDLAERHH